MKKHHIKGRICGFFSAATLLFALLQTSTAQAVNCQEEANSIQRWIECDGVQVTQTYGSPQGARTNIEWFSEIPESNSVVWRYTSTTGSGITTRIDTTYYTNTLDGKNLRALSQTVRQNTTYDEKLEEFQVVNHRAVWRLFDGVKSCQGNCTSTVSYHYACLADSNHFQITPTATSTSYLNTDRIENFSLTGNTASWSFYNSDSGTTTQQSEYLGVCQQPRLELATPGRPTATVSGSSISVDWADVPNADYYLVAIKFNNNAWTGFNYSATNSFISWSGLGAGDRRYKVKACYSDGTCSGESAESNTATIQPSGLGTPSTPVAWVSGNTLTVDWSDVPGAYRYAVSIKFNDRPWTGYIYYSSVGQSSISWSNLGSGTRRYRVKACDSAGVCYGASGASSPITN